MLSFPSQNVKNFFRPAGVLKDTDLGDGKPTHF